ncbi:MAG TPA: hypothetical protein VGQ70_01045, partial [Candidatus Udaeobacter sp.]|nr:hypothetical protein [Candidatus Udaeobacter sp.]
LFPTVETLVAQLIAAVLVIGSYYAARHFGGALPQSTEPVQEARAEADAAIVESLESPVKAAETESSANAARPLADEMDSRQRGGRIVATGRI